MTMPVENDGTWNIYKDIVSESEELLDDIRKLHDMIEAAEIVPRSHVRAVPRTARLEVAPRSNLYGSRSARDTAGSDAKRGAGVNHPSVRLGTTFVDASGGLMVTREELYSYIKRKESK